ncbi:MAG: hypothetical protein A2176_08800, partial [Spirochaetes bacterium RBG_13_51_14]
GKCKNIDFQKFLFLFNEMSSKKYFYFVPYKYGCFSFQSYSDKRALANYNILDNSDFWHIKDQTDYISQLSDEDRTTLYNFKNKYFHLNGSKLINYVYKNYPYYAINSEILNLHLSIDDIEKINENKNMDDSIILFTIGYEGKSIDEYLNLLIKNNIKILCDVRKNALSMKYGFSKNQLKDSLHKIGINYIHIPELGVDSAKRKSITNNLNYKILFQEYQKEIISSKLSILESLNNIFHLNRRIALTCFESDHNRCHRHILANEVLKLNHYNYKLYNI